MAQEGSPHRPTRKQRKPAKQGTEDPKRDPQQMQLEVEDEGIRAAFRPEAEGAAEEEQQEAQKRTLLEQRKGVRQKEKKRLLA